MLGRVRSSPMAMSSLEMERSTPSKFIKHDSLSIYESTILKLKQGSHCNQSINPEDSGRMDEPCTMETETSDADCFDSFASSSSSLKSTDPSNEQECRNMSILYMFSKYKTSHDEQSTNGKVVKMIQTGSSSSSSCSVSPMPSC